MTQTSGLDEVDPFEDFNRAMGADGDASPYPELAEWRRGAPIFGGPIDLGEDAVGASHDVDALVPTTMHVFTAYSFDAVQAVLGDGESFSSAGYAEVMGQVLGHSILEMDNPEHRAYRSLIQQAFTRKEMERWEAELVAPLVDRMIDEFVDDGHVDLVRALFFPFPVNVIAELMGLPPSDLPEFHRLAVELISVVNDFEKAVQASASLCEYFGELVHERRGSEGRDLISVLANVRAPDGRQLDDDEIFSFLRLLLPAGAETTYRSSSNLMFGLLSHPDQLEAVRADRSLLPQAIEEGLRWEPPLLTIVRTATRDVEVCGVQVPAGSTVVTNLGSANRDEQRWDDPDRFDIFRERRPHLAFAHGPHMCLGMHLARMETTVVLGALLDRLPQLRFDPAAEPAFISGMTFRAPPRLAVTWG